MQTAIFPLTGCLFLRPDKLAWRDCPPRGKVRLESELFDGRRVHGPSRLLCPM
jgi:hypothetical protein